MMAVRMTKRRRKVMGSRHCRMRKKEERKGENSDWALQNTTGGCKVARALL